MSLTFNKLAHNYLKNVHNSMIMEEIVLFKKLDTR